MSSDEGELILDPFMGTGTTAIASKRLGRSYIGFDLDEKYVQICLEKLEKEKQILKIGKNYVSYFLDEIVTIRDVDWDDLSNHFLIPDNLKEIDHSKAMLKTGHKIIRYNQHYLNKYRKQSCFNFK